MKTINIIIFFIFTSILAQSQIENYVIFCGKFFNSEKAIFEKNKYILATNDKVISVKDEYEPKSNDKYLDLSDYTIMPGLIDCHTHFLHNEYFNGKTKKLEIDSLIFQNEDYRNQLGEKNLTAYLNEGFTSIRDLGNSGNFLEKEFKDKNAKDFQYPSIYSSGKGIVFQRGQFPKKFEKYEQDEYLIIHDSLSIQNAINQLENEGVDLIKVYADNAPNKELMPPHLFSYIVEESHKRGFKITAHAIYDRSIKNAALAGVDCIEHIYGISDATMDLIREKGITVVPTFEDKYSVSKIIKHAPKNKFLLRIFMPIELKKNRKLLKKLHDNKINICTGSDAYLDDRVVESRGKSAKSGIYCLIESKIPMNEVLQMATYNGSILLGEKGKIGQIKKGAYADIIAVKGDVQKNKNLLKEIRFIMKRGVVIKHE